MKRRDLARLERTKKLRVWQHRPDYWRCDVEGCDGRPHDRWTENHARRTEGRSQAPPPGDWLIRYIRGGRGSGKSWAASNTLADLILESEPGEWGVIAPTFADARDVCMAGPSGLIRSLGGIPGPGGLLIHKGPWLHSWNVSTGQLRTVTGSLIYTDGANDGALRVQGKNLRGAWADEIGLWEGGNPKAKQPMWQVAWEESIRYAVRLEPAKIIVSGTPKSNRSARRLVQRLIDDPKVPVDLLFTEDNAANLSPDILEEWLANKGTRMGAQELYGELLSDVEGALVTWDDIIPFRVAQSEVPDLRRVLVSVDPSFSNTETSDECGIVGVGEGSDHHAYVLADWSGRYSIDAWSKRAVLLAWEIKANAIVYESNLAGEVVKRHLLGAINDLLTNKDAWGEYGGRPDNWHAPRLIPRAAKLPKEGRLEVVAPLYQQHRVHHVGPLDALETQITSWTPDDSYSPDRMDACTAGLAELNVGRPAYKRRLMGDVAAELGLA